MGGSAGSVVSRLVNTYCRSPDGCVSHRSVGGKVTIKRYRSHSQFVQVRADNCRVSRNGNERSSPNGGQLRKSGRSSFFHRFCEEFKYGQIGFGRGEKKKLILSFLCVAVVGFIIFCPFKRCRFTLLYSCWVVLRTCRDLLCRCSISSDSAV